MASSSNSSSDDLENIRTLKQHLQNKIVSNVPDLQLKPIKTKQEKHSLKGIFRNVSVDSSSSEYYADSPVAVPFRWESQPGTPKTRHGESLIPPLTPPPSSTRSPAKKHVKKQPMSTSLLQNVLSFAKRSPRKAPSQHFVPHTLSYTMSPTSYSAPSSPCRPRSRAERRQSIVDSGDYESTSLMSCFSFGPRLNARSSGSSDPSTLFHTKSYSKKQDLLKALPKQ